LLFHQKEVLYICNMKGKTDIGLDFIIDKLTNSIENILTGDSFATEISVLTQEDLKLVGRNKGWMFNWKDEFKMQLAMYLNLLL